MPSLELFASSYHFSSRKSSGLGLCEPGPFEVLLVDMSGVANHTRQSLEHGALACVQHGLAAPTSTW